MNKFQVSVIIPVYNAEAYLKTAVLSAVNLDEVAEVILVEDASPDNALQVAQELEGQFDKIKLFQHPDKGNHGAGASRNLGIINATCDYIAFLDADDYYLPDRFTKDKEIFERYPDAEGVYSCVGTHFYSEKAKQQFFDKGFGYQEQLTLSDTVPPEELFSVLFHRHPQVTGEFCTDGITLKRSVFEKVGYFHIDLKLRQDIHLWKRLAGFCKLYAGEIHKPVAMRGIHPQNRMTVKEDHKQYEDLWWQSLRLEFQKKGLETAKYALFEQASINYFAGHHNKFTALKALFLQMLKYPNTIKKAYGFFDFNFWKVFGENGFTLRVISLKNRWLS